MRLSLTETQTLGRYRAYGNYSASSHFCETSIRPSALRILDIRPTSCKLHVAGKRHRAFFTNFILSFKTYFLSRNARQSLKPAVTTNHVSEVSHNYYSRPKYRPRLNLCIPHTETKRREPTTYVDKRKVSQLCKPHSPDLVHHWLLYCRGQVREAPMRKDLFLFLVHTKKTQNKIAEYRLTLS